MRGLWAQPYTNAALRFTMVERLHGRQGWRSRGLHGETPAERQATLMDCFRVGRLQEGAVRVCVYIYIFLPTCEFTERAHFAMLLCRLVQQPDLPFQ